MEGKNLLKMRTRREDSKKWKTLNTGFLLDSHSEKQFAGRTVAEACFRERRCQY